MVTQLYIVIEKMLILICIVIIFLIIRCMVKESSVVGFRMSRELLLLIADAVAQHDNYFHQRRIANSRLGLSTLQKVIVAIRILAYGVHADAINEYIKIGEYTVIECMKRFCLEIVDLLLEWYLKSPTSEDVARFLSIGQQCGFLRMLGSPDYMH